MNIKTKHRILGILVVVGLAVILFPLFQSNKNSTPTTIVKAPPFPDQANVSPTTVVNNPIPVEVVRTENTVPQPDDTISINRPSIASNPVPDLPKPENLEVDKTNNVAQEIKNVDAINPNDVKDNDQNDSIKINKLAPIDVKNIDKIANVIQIPAPTKKVTHIAKRARQHKINSMPSVNDNNGLAKLKDAVWVIQMGNFKNKTKAIHLVNHLRMNGYRAFIQQVSTVFGNSTRVFVGPEYKQHAAFELADRLEKDIHIRGMVISYKPLSL